MATHKLKTWPQFYKALKRGDKTFEVRKNDRNFTVGDELILEEYDPQSCLYSGDTTTRFVVYVMKSTPDELFGIKDGYVVLGLVNDPYEAVKDMRTWPDEIRRENGIDI